MKRSQGSRGRSMTGSGLKLLGGAAVGGILMYLFDPREGASRRSRLSRTASSAVQGAGDALSTTWSDLAERARHVGQHVAEHASKLSDHAADLAQSARASTEDAAAGIGQTVSTQAHQVVEQLTDLAGRARKYLSGARDRAGNYADDLTDYAGAYFRPQPSSSVPGYTLTAAGALALGLGAMYFLDPDEGRRRRQMIAGHATDIVGQTGCAFRSTGNYLRQQFNTVVSEIRGQSASPAGNMNSRDWNTASPMATYPTTYPGNRGSQYLPQNWPLSTTTRLGIGIAGGALGFYGATRRDWVGLGVGTLGLGMIAAGLASVDFTRLSDSLTGGMRSQLSGSSEYGSSAANLTGAGATQDLTSGPYAADRSQDYSQSSYSPSSSSEPSGTAP